MADDSMAIANPTIEIRSATKHDLDALLDLANQTLDHHIAGDPHVFEPFRDPVERRASYARLFEDQTATVFIASIGDRLVGYAVVLEMSVPDVPGLRPRRIARIEDLGVDKAHRRNGIGRRLMVAALSLAQNKRVDAVELQVYEFNTGAIALYESFGFETASRRMRLVLDAGA